MILIAGVAWYSRGQIAYARIATGYAAKQTCSCIHVSGRSLESCLADFPPEAGDSLRVEQDGDEVHASVLFGAITARARYEEEFGCTLLN